MKTTDWLMIALCWGPLIYNFLMDRRREKRRQEVVDLLDEVRRCNGEFAEALALARYGAYSEAIEVATAWKKRFAANPLSGARGVAGMTIIGRGRHA